MIIKSQFFYINIQRPDTVIVTLIINQTSSPAAQGNLLNFYYNFRQKYFNLKCCIRVFGIPPRRPPSVILIYFPGNAFLVTILIDVVK